MCMLPHHMLLLGEKLFEDAIKNLQTVKKMKN